MLTEEELASIVSSYNAPAQQQQSSTPEGIPISGVFEPFTKALIAGVPKWAGERVSGMQSFLPEELGTGVRYVGDKVSGMVDDKTRSDIDATMGQEWDFSNKRNLPFMQRFSEGMSKISAMIGDQLPMWGEAGLESTAVGKAAQMLLKQGSPYAKVAGGIAALSAFTFMSAGPMRKRMEAAKFEDGTPVFTPEEMDSHVRMSAPIEGAVEYLEAVTAKALGVVAKAGGSIKAGVGAVEGVLAKPAVAYVSEPIEEISQGLIQQSFIEDAVKQAEARTGKKVNRDSIGSYGADEMLEDGIAAMTLTGFFHASGSAARLATRRVDADTARENAAAMNRIGQLSGMKDADGKPMRVISESQIEAISTELYNASQRDPAARSWRNRDSFTDMLSKAKLQMEEYRAKWLAEKGVDMTEAERDEYVKSAFGEDALAQFNAETHRNIYATQGAKSASRYLAHIFKMPVVDDKATTKEIYDAVLAYTADEKNLIATLDPDTNEYMMVPKAPRADLPHPFTTGDITAIFKTGIHAPYAEVKESLINATKGAPSKWHIEIDRNALKNEDLLSQLTGIKDKAKLAMLSEKGEAVLDMMQATTGKGKLLYSHVSVYDMTREEARETEHTVAPGQQTVRLRAGAQNTVVNGTPVITLYHGFNNSAIVEDFGELLSRPEMSMAISGDPKKMDAWWTLRAMQVKHNNNFLDSSDAYLKQNEAVDPNTLPTPEARKKLLMDKIQETAKLLKDGKGTGSSAATANEIQRLVGMNGMDGWYGQIQNDTDFTPDKFQRFFKELGRLRSRNALLTTTEYIRHLRDMYPTKDNVGSRERFWKAVTLGMWGQSQFANAGEVAKYENLQISDEDMKTINTAVETIVGRSVFQRMVKNPNTEHGKMFDLSQMDKSAMPGEQSVRLTDKKLPTKADQITELTAKIGELVDKVGSLESALAGRTPANQPSSPVEAITEPTPSADIPPTPKAPVAKPSRRGTRKGSKPSTRTVVTPVQPEATATPPETPAIDLGQFGDKLTALGYSPEDIAAMSGDDRAQIVELGLSKAVVIDVTASDQELDSFELETSDETIEQEIQDTVAGASDMEMENLDKNALTQEAHMKMLLSSKSRIGIFSSYVTLATGKKIATKIGEDYLFDELQKPNNVIDRFIANPDLEKKIMDGTATFGDVNAKEQYIAKAIAFAVSTQGYSKGDLKSISKNYKALRRMQVLYISVSDLPGNEWNPERKEFIHLYPNNSRDLQYKLENMVRTYGPDKLLKAIQKSGGTMKLRTDIMALAKSRDSADAPMSFDPESGSEMLESITGIPARIWKASYLNGQNHVSMFEKGDYGWQVSHGQGSQSGTIAALANISFDLVHAKSITTREQALAFLDKALVLDRITKPKKGSGKKNRVHAAPIRQIGTQAIDSSALNGSYVSVDGKQASSYVYQTQEIDGVEAILKRVDPNLNVQDNMVIFDGINSKYLSKAGRKTDKTIRWDDMSDNDRRQVSLQMLARGYVELSQIGDKTKGYFMKMPHVKPENTLWLRHLDVTKQTDLSNQAYMKIAGEIQELYSKEYRKLNAHDKKIVVKPAELLEGPNAESILDATTYAYYNLLLAKEIDGDLSNYDKGGVFSYNDYNKRRSQAGTGGVPLADGKPIKTMVIHDLDPKKVPELKKAIAAFQKASGIVRTADAVDGMAVFMPKFGKRYQEEMGGILADPGTADDSVFGIKAHYRNDGTLIKVNYINLLSLSKTGSKVWKDLYNQLKDTDVDLVVFNETGVKVGKLDITNVWSDKGTIKSFTPVINELDSNRFYTPLKLNSDMVEHGKQAKQREHNELHMPNADLRTGLMAQVIDLKLPQWKESFNEILATVRGELPPGLNKASPQAIAKWKRGLWEDLFGSNEDLIEQAMAGVNPFGHQSLHRTIPLLISKMQRMFEIGGERLNAQGISAMDNPDVQMPIVTDKGVIPATVIANLRHADGSDLMEAISFPTREEAIQYVWDHSQDMPWFFQMDPDGAPIFSKDTLKEYLITEYQGSYVVPGEMFTTTRTPADNVPSGNVVSFSRHGGNAKNAIMLPVDMMVLKGMDADGDQEGIILFNKVNGVITFDPDTVEGLENRILMSYMQDALNKDLHEYWSVDIATDTALSLYHDKAKAQMGEKGKMAINSRETNNRFRATMTASQQAIGISASMNRLADFIFKYGLYQQDKETGDKFELIAPKDAKFAYDFKKLVTAPLVSLTADDSKNGYLEPLNMGPNGVSLFVAMALQDKTLLGDGNYTDKEKAVAALIDKLQSPDAREFTKLMAIQRYSALQYGSDKYYNQNPLFMRVKKQDWMDAKTASNTVEGQLKAKAAKDVGWIWDAYDYSRQLQSINRMVNVGMRTFSGTDIVEIAQGIRLMDEESRVLAFGDAFQTGYGKIIKSIQKAYSTIAPLDFTQSKVFSPLLIDENNRMRMAEEARMNIRDASKAITDYVINTQFDPVSIDAEWLQIQQEAIAAGAPVPGAKFLTLLQSTSDGKGIQLSQFSRGELNPDTTSWDQLPMPVQAGLFKVMVDQYGYANSVRNGTWMSRVSPAFNIELNKAVDKQVQIWMDGFDQDTAQRLVDSVLGVPVDPQSTPVETPSPQAEVVPNPDTAIPVGASDQVIEEVYSDISTAWVNLEPAVKDALKAYRDRPLLTSILNDIPKLLAPNRDPDEWKRKLSLAMIRLEGVLGTENDALTPLREAINGLTRLENTLPVTVEGLATPTPGVGMDSGNEARLEASTPLGEPFWTKDVDIGAYDTVIQESIASMPAFTNGSKSIRIMLVNEMNNMRALKEMAHREADIIRSISKRNPYLLRVAAFVQESPAKFKDPKGNVMDPWPETTKPEYANLSKAYHENKADVDQIIKLAGKQFDLMREEFNKAVSQFSDKGFIRFIEDYVPHLWASPGMSSDILKNKLRSFGTKHQMERKLPTLFDGKEMGLTPLNLDIANMIEAYSDTIYTKMAQRRIIEMAITVMNKDGQQTVVPVFAGNHHTRPQLMETVAGQLSMQTGDPAPPQNPKEWSSLLKKFPDMINRVIHGEQEYKFFESSYKDFDGFYVHPDAINVMKTVLNVHARPFDWKFVQALEHVNTWSKYNALQLSMFHMISILTGIGASLGGHHRMFKWENWHPTFKWNTKDFKQWLKDHPEFEEDMVRAGLQYGRWLDVDGGAITEDLAKAHAWASHNKYTVATKSIEFMQNYKKGMDKHLWRNLHAMSKIYLAYDLKLRYEAEALKKGIKLDNKILFKEIANYVNTTAGGLDWNNIAWATPTVRRLMHLFLFAPDWTFSNIEIFRAGVAGLPNALGGNIANQLGITGPFDKLTKTEALKRYWPTMIVFSYVLPNMMQLMVNMMAGGTGDDDEEKVFAFQNEMGRTKAVRVTPLLRRMNEIPFFKYIGLGIDATKNQEEFYMDFSKQINEMGDWLEAPFKTLKNKTSMIFKIAYEQAVGNNTSGRELPFKDENTGHFRGFLSADGQFWESRAGYILEKFVPMSMMAILKDRPMGVIAPIGKGMTASKFKIELTQVLQAYADPNFYDKITGVPGYVDRLDQLAPELIKAARENGVPVERHARATIAKVRSEYTDRLFRAVNTQNWKMGEQAAESFMRLGGGIDTIYRSFRAKLLNSGGTLEPGALDAVHEYMTLAAKRIQRDREAE